MLMTMEKYTFLENDQGWSRQLPGKVSSLLVSYMEIEIKMKFKKSNQTGSVRQDINKIKSKGDVNTDPRQ